jgi:hypothetical protein
MKKMVFFQEISNENKQEEVFFHSVEEEEFFFVKVECLVTETI